MLDPEFKELVEKTLEQDRDELLELISNYISKLVVNRIKEIDSLEDTLLKQYIDDRLNHMKAELSSSDSYILDQVGNLSRSICGREELDPYFYRGDRPIIDKLDRLESNIDSLREEIYRNKKDILN